MVLNKKQWDDHGDLGPSQMLRHSGDERSSRPYFSLTEANGSAGQAEQCKQYCIHVSKGVNTAVVKKSVPRPGFQ